MDKKGLDRVLNEVLAPDGFRKKGNAWYRNTPEVLQIVDLQKSSYGGNFYINLAFAPLGMSVEGMPHPKEHKCPIRIRLTSLLDAPRAEIESAFDLEGNLTDELRVDRIQSLFHIHALPFLNSLRSLASLAIAAKEGKFRNGMVSLAVKAYLNIEE